MLTRCKKCGKAVGPDCVPIEAYKYAGHRLVVSYVFIVRCTLVQSALLRLHVVSPTIRPSSCDVGGSRPHRLEVLETNCTEKIFKAKKSGFFLFKSAFFI